MRTICSLISKRTAAAHRIIPPWIRLCVGGRFTLVKLPLQSIYIGVHNSQHCPMSTLKPGSVWEELLQARVCHTENARTHSHEEECRFTAVCSNMCCKELRSVGQKFGLSTCQSGIRSDCGADGWGAVLEFGFIHLIHRYSVCLCRR